MSQPTEGPTLEELAPFVGEWDLQPRFSFPVPEDVTGRVVFEWMSGGRFLVERWEVSHPEAPDGIAIIGRDEGGDGYLQHYFDSRGVARVYRMTFADGVWTLGRTTPDFTALDFSQRFEGRFTDDGSAIEGVWEICEDGETWTKDFDLTYWRIS